MERMILDKLRQATRQQHEALEAVLPLSQAAANPQLYDHLLERFWGFYATWEYESLHAAEPSLRAMLAARRKLPLLAADLVARGRSIAHLPTLAAQALPAFAHGAPTLLGSMYVVEGATLGGQVISRSLERQGFHDGHGYSFFQSYGSAAGQQWKAFVTQLETIHPDDAGACVEAAQATFTAFAAWFAEGGFNGGSLAGAEA